MHADVAREIAYSGRFCAWRVHEPQAAFKYPQADGVTTGDFPPVEEELDADNEPDMFMDESANAHGDRSASLPFAFELKINDWPVPWRAVDVFEERIKRWKNHRNEAKKHGRGEKDKDTRGVVRSAKTAHHLPP
ncbi:hypothetical protein BD413DRAFT_616941 [Trametes elegans]|nr:hypothetical protein BD413DRAFT_616941 [Trametes elegans]